MFVGIGVVALWVLYRLMQGAAPQPGAESPAAAETGSPAETLAPPVVAPAAREPVAEPDGPVAVHVVIENSRRVQGPDAIRLREGQSLKLTITADADDELHLHGYDRHLHLHAGEPATLELVADRSGRFEYELHGAHAVIGVLEVFPN